MRAAGGLIVLLLVATTSPAAAQCLRFGAPTKTGAIAHPEIVESSGLAASLHQPGVYFTHNDSGDTPRLFAVGAAGEDLGAFDVEGATHRDWEDLALGPCAAAPACLFVGDVGDNAKIWETVTVYRAPEPQVGAAAEAVPAAALELTYPDGARDCEAVLVDPMTGDLFLVEKTEALAARVSVLRDAARAPAGAHALEALGSLEVTGFVTGGDFAPTGREIVLRTYAGEASRWLARRDDRGQVVAFDRLDMPEIDPLGEAVAYRADALALVTTREAEGAPLYETPCVSPDGTEPGPAVGPLVAAPGVETSKGCGGDSQAILLVLPAWGARRRRRKTGRGVGRRLAPFLVVAALVAAPAVAHAEVSHRVYAALAGGFWPSPQSGGHGILLAEWRAYSTPGDGRFTLAFNTDTLRARYDDLCFGRVCLGAELAGEVLVAGLLSDYYRRGGMVQALEFRASYAAASVFAELRLPDRWFARYTATGRKWFFSDFEVQSGVVDPAGGAVLSSRPPPEAWVAEQALALTWWQLEPDKQQWEAHRLFPRVKGLALGLRAEVHVRSDARPWGESDAPLAGDSTQADPFAGVAGGQYTDRNDPSQVIWLVRQWSRFGGNVAPRVRLQLEQRFAWSAGEDDLVRDRIGGLNPYVVPVGGTPWAAFLSGRYMSGRLSAHVFLGGDVEAGAFFDAVAMPGSFRDGSRRLGGVIGTGGFVDARFGDWQADLWVAYAPGLQWGLEQHYIGMFAALGRRLR